MRYLPFIFLITLFNSCSTVNDGDLRVIRKTGRVPSGAEWNTTFEVHRSGEVRIAVGAKCKKEIFLIKRRAFEALLEGDESSLNPSKDILYDRVTDDVIHVAKIDLPPGRYVLMSCNKSPKTQLFGVDIQALGNKVSVPQISRKSSRKESIKTMDLEGFRDFSE